jgi:hypothetical protein
MTSWDVISSEQKSVLLIQPGFVEKVSVSAVAKTVSKPTLAA